MTAELPRDPMVHVAGLVKRFPVGAARRSNQVVHAVDGIDVDVPAGRTLAIVGESGCGKSTVAKAMVGLITPTAGEILIGGKRVPPVTSKARHERRRVQLVSQSPWSALNRRKTVRHIVSQPLVVHRLLASRQARETRVRELVERVGLAPEYLDRRAHELSGGELQRVTIARALAVGPDVLVLDEPTASLDVSVKAILVNLLTDLQRDLGLTYVLITHELDIALHLADRVAVMYLGRLVEVGPVADVFERPGHPYTRALLAAVPSVNDLGMPPVVSLKGEVPSAVDVPAGCGFHTRCPFAEQVCREATPTPVAHGDTVVACLRLADLPGPPAGTPPTRTNRTESSA
ncbi:oligopeptide/dipeptide ABC transporter ATP-binding protein [Sphaerimonospora sp. CA-214678]|uniref:oligopeptide/dipeptide ABC transporter ATP-binding protein n=1 Tax=Sphaerimonospora sp. CA-214678 TaxID=3240029 RepID=UPI003D8BA226